MHQDRFRLSIVMPAYNEERTIVAAVTELLEADLPFDHELIVVDDGSSDGTAACLIGLDDPRLRCIRHPRNLGKGAALLTGAELATGTHILPFDADREYDPNDIPRLVAPVLEGRASVVFGTRLFGANTVYHSYRYAAGNRALTLAANVLYDAAVTDLHTCFKLVPLPLFRSLDLQETGFGLDTELAAAILRQGARPFEVPISYFARTHGDGKKIGWRDGVECLRILGRHRIRAKRRDITVAEPRVWNGSPAARRRPRFTAVPPQGDAHTPLADLTVLDASR